MTFEKPTVFTAPVLATHFGPDLEYIEGCSGGNKGPIHGCDVQTGGGDGGCDAGLGVLAAIVGVVGGGIFTVAVAS